MARTTISEGIALGVLASAVTISPIVHFERIEYVSNGVVSVDYAKVVRPADILPFRLTITNIGIEGYRENNPPGIGIQVIGFSNYIL
jgi:hypothetical protein